MPGEQALQIAREAIDALRPPSRSPEANCWCANYHDVERVGHSNVCVRVTTALAEIDAALAAEGSEEQGSARSLPSWRIGAPPDGFKLVPVEPTEAMLKAACVGWQVSDHDLAKADAADSYRAMVTAAEPPAPVMAALGAATKAGSGMEPNPSQGEVAGLVAVRDIILEHMRASGTVAWPMEGDGSDDPADPDMFCGYLSYEQLDKLADALTRTTPSPDPILGEVVKVLTECEQVFALVEHSSIEDPQHGEEVRALGERIGFGAVMASASASWRKMAIVEGSEFVAGPCQITVRRTLELVRALLSLLQARGGR